MRKKRTPSIPGSFFYERILGTKTRLKTNVILSKRSLREDPQNQSTLMDSHARSHSLGMTMVFNKTPSLSCAGAQSTPPSEGNCDTSPFGYSSSQRRTCPKRRIKNLQSGKNTFIMYLCKKHILLRETLRGTRKRRHYEKINLGIVRCINTGFLRWLL